MAKTKPQRRPRAAPPRGFRDYFGAEVRARSAMLARVTEVYEAYGFEPLESPAVETLEALGKHLPDVDRPHDGVFAWSDPDEGWLALRYDLTAPLARVFAQHRQQLPTPYRRYAVGPVWRNEKPGPGRFRQFYQCDADTVGAASVAADAEMCVMLADALEAAGVARSDYVIRLNSRKVLNGVLEAAGLLDPAEPGAGAARRGIVMRAVDKLDRLGPEGVRALLGPGRRDESGDFTEGAGLGEGQAELILEFLASGQAGADATCARLRALVAGSPAGLAGVQDLETIVKLAVGPGSDRMVVDPSVVRGLGYYTGPVYEAELTFETTDEAGRPRRFGSVAGGGRYDDLVTRFTGEAVPATGISIGVDRLMAALESRGALAAAGSGPVVVTVMDRDRMGDYQRMAAEIRAAGLRAEVFLGGGSMGRQLKYADRRGSPVAVIEGGDERARGVVQLKDLALGARLAADIETRADWAAQPAQVEVPRDRLAAEVRAMVARAGA